MSIIDRHQKKILQKMNNVINYWINWAKKFNKLEYLFYEYYMKQLLDFDFNNLFEKKMS